MWRVKKDSVWTLLLEGRLDLQEKPCKCCQICKHGHLKSSPLKQTSTRFPLQVLVELRWKELIFSIHLFSFLLLFRLMNLKMSPCYVLVDPWTLSKWCQSALKGSKREATPYLLKNPNKSDNNHFGKNHLREVLESSIELPQCESQELWFSGVFWGWMTTLNLKIKPHIRIPRLDVFSCTLSIIIPALHIQKFKKKTTHIRFSHDTLHLISIYMFQEWTF